MRGLGYVWLFSVAASVGWVTFLLILFNVDPFSATWYEFIFFYFSLSLAFVATFFITGWIMRAVLMKRFDTHDTFGVLFRQSLFLTALVVVLLLFQSVRALAWWNMLMFASALLFFEIFFIMYEKKR